MKQTVYFLLGELLYIHPVMRRIIEDVDGTTFERVIANNPTQHVKPISLGGHCPSNVSIHMCVYAKIGNWGAWLGYDCNVCIVAGDDKTTQRLTSLS